VWIGGCHAVRVLPRSAHEIPFLRRELYDWWARDRFALSSITKVFKNCHCDYQKCSEIGSDSLRNIPAVAKFDLFKELRSCLEDPSTLCLVHPRRVGRFGNPDSDLTLGWAANSRAWRVCAKHHTLIVVMVTTLLLIGLRNRALSERNSKANARRQRRRASRDLRHSTKLPLAECAFKKKQVCGQKASLKITQGRFWAPPVCKS
jgi:hypothetical protein